MVICKYYQQGTCRFGNNCRFEHSSDYSSAGDPGFRARFTGHHYSTPNYYSNHNKSSGSYKLVGSSQDIEEVMKMIVQEVIQMEKGGQWPLTCFAPIKERQCFPGWDDHSPEEIRWKMYEALKNGTFPECQRQIKELYEAAKLRRNNLLNPNEEIYKIVDKILRGQKIETETSFSFLQAANQASNKFGLWNTPSFSNNVQTSVVSPNFTFTLPQFGNSVSVNQAPVQQPPSVFGVSSVQPVTNVSSQVPTVFNEPNQVQTSSPFGIFAQAAQNLESFQQQSQLAMPSSNSRHVFGGKSVFNNNSGSDMNKLDNVDTSVYSLKSDLTEDECNAFLAQTFTMGKVPTKPPPKEFCTA